MPLMPLFIAVATTALAIRLCFPWRGWRQVGWFTWALIAYSSYSWFQIADSSERHYVQGAVSSIETQQRPGRFGRSNTSSLAELALYGPASSRELITARTGCLRTSRRAVAWSAPGSLQRQSQA